MLSQGLMQTTSYWAMEGRVLSQRWYTSGDALFTESVFTHMGVLPTDPGAAQRRERAGWQPRARCA